MPESFIRRHERHRFLLPGARIEGYDPLDTNAATKRLEAGRIVVVHRGLGETRTGPFRVMARRLDLTSRHTREEIWGNMAYRLSSRARLARSPGVGGEAVSTRA